MQPLSPIPNLAGSLRSSQHQLAEKCDLAPAEIQHLSETMQVLGNPAAASGSFRRKLLIAQRLDGLSYQLFVVGDDGIAVRFLVACEHESIQRKRIILGR